MILLMNFTVGYCKECHSKRNHGLLYQHNKRNFATFPEKKGLVCFAMWSMIFHTWPKDMNEARIVKVGPGGFFSLKKADPLPISPSNHAHLQSTKSNQRYGEGREPTWTKGWEALDVDSCGFARHWASTTIWNDCFRQSFGELKIPDRFGDDLQIFV